jgi:hypothetical protein
VLPILKKNNTMPNPIHSFSGLLAVLLVFFALPLLGQDVPSATPALPLPSGPTTTLEFEETTYDFGIIKSGPIVSQVFTFTNTGDEPLIVTEVRGSCGCTVPQWPRAPLAPGETASITVEFNSKNKYGQRNQRVTLTANTNPPQTFIYLAGELLRPEESDGSFPNPVVAEPELEISPDCFAIFPNPTAEILKLDMEDNSLGKSAVISIYSKTGQVMARREIPAVEGTIEFNVSHYPAGTYVAQVQVGKGKPVARCFVVVE